MHVISIIFLNFKQSYLFGVIISVHNFLKALYVFSFKTKGNLTKHMKSKAHTKNSTVSSGSGSSTQQSATPSSESDTEDSGMDSSGKCHDKHSE